MKHKENQTIVIGKRTYSLKDQHLFSDISGDWNPIHVDPLLSRRLICGDLVVHGMHVVLESLNFLASLPKVKSSTITRIYTKFIKPIYLSRELTFKLNQEKIDNLYIEVNDNGSLLTQIYIDIEPKSSYLQDVSTKIKAPYISNPNILTDKDLYNFNQTIKISCETSLLKKEFEKANDIFGSQILLICSQVSQVVGMKCPGKDSLLAAVEINRSYSSNKNDLENKINFFVSSFDNRFKNLKICFSTSHYSGKINSFLRPRPVEQPSIKEALKLVDDRIFSNQRALIIGGSRGIGELVAKLLCAGSAEILLTYHQGQKEAESIVEEIRRFGLKADSINFNVLDMKNYSHLIEWRPTHLYYFATPYIFSGQKAQFSNEKFYTFCQYYVEAFVELVDILLDFDLTHIFYPSTVALNTYPTHMLEYCAAKSAGESICNSLRNKHPRLTINCLRLPLIKTDQTNSLLPQSSFNKINDIYKLLIDF